MATSSHSAQGRNAILYCGMSPVLALAAACAGYLVGSVPFALVVFRVFGRGRTLETSVFKVPGSGEILESNAVSATAVRLQLGSRYGCLTALLDMAKAAAVTLAFRLALPQHPYDLIASGLCVAGHIWPLFHRFRGGRGQSPAIGGLFVIDWTAPLIAYPRSLLFGVAVRSRAYVDRFAPMLLAAGWLYYRTGRLSHVFYAVGIGVIRGLAMRNEIRQYARLRRRGQLRTLAEELEFLGLADVTSRITGFLQRVAAPFRSRREP